MAEEGAAVSKGVKIVRGSGNVFRDLGFSETEARNLALRSELMIRIEQFVEGSGLTQVRAAQRLGLTQPRLNALLRGKIDLFSLDELVTIASRAGLTVELRVRPAKPARHSAAAAS
jgi:predicted XRE-type DNA-binding protein